jgi:hypothetical protein
MVLCFLEIIVYAASEAFVSEVLRAEDVGGSMVIHTFGKPPGTRRVASRARTDIFGFFSLQAVSP